MHEALQETRMLDQRARLSRRSIPTGQPALDTLMCGGFPRGQITEISGGPSSGRRTLAFAAAARCRATGGDVYYFDGEGTGYDHLWARKLGLIPHPAHAVLFRAVAASADEIFQAIEQLARVGVDLIVVSGVPAALKTSETIAPGASSRPDDEGRAARLKAFLHRINRVLRATGTALVMINQTRVPMNGRGDRERPVCDRTFQRHASLRLRTELVAEGFLTPATGTLRDGPPVRVGSLHQLCVIKHRFRRAGGIEPFGIEFEPSPGLFEVTADTRCVPDEELA